MNVSEIWHIILAHTDQPVFPNPFTGPANIQASLIFRRPGDPEKFDIAIEGPLAPTVDDALQGLLNISSRLFTVLDNERKPTSAGTTFEVEGGKVNEELLPMMTEEVRWRASQTGGVDT